VLSMWDLCVVVMLLLTLLHAAMNRQGPKR